MDKNENLYKASWHLVHASRLIKKYDVDMSKELLLKADELAKQINVNQEEIKEIERYEQQLREAT
jgi:hypothetical protein